MENRYDVIVIGGGVMGCSLIYNLSKLGKKVLLLEKEDLTKGSAGATDGVVGYHTKKPGASMELAIESINMFKELEKELDEDIELCDDSGGMIVVQSREEYEVLEQIVKEQVKSGVDIKMLDIEEARKLEPQLSKKLYGAMYSHSSKKVNPIKLTLAYAKTAKRLGAEILIEHEVVDLLIEDINDNIYEDEKTYKHNKEDIGYNKYKKAKKIIGVKTNKGNFYSDNVVNTCGALAGEVSKLAGIDIPIRPRKGQLIVSEPIGPFITNTIQCARYNIIKFAPELVNDEDMLKYGLSLSIEQTEDGSLIIGSTRELVGFDKENTLEAIESMLKRAVIFFPSLKDISFIRCFAGLRPYTPDGLALIGEVKDIKGYYIGAGHEGDGIALAPITGKLLAQLIVDGKTSYNIESFSPNRFTNIIN